MKSEVLRFEADTTRLSGDWHFGQKVLLFICLIRSMAYLPSVWNTLFGVG